MHLSQPSFAPVRGLSAGQRVTVGERAYLWVLERLNRARERAELRRLDPRDRQDIGFARVLDEDSTPVWRV